MWGCVYQQVVSVSPCVGGWVSGGVCTGEWVVSVCVWRVLHVYGWVCGVCVCSSVVRGGVTVWYQWVVSVRVCTSMVCTRGGE